MKHNSSRREAVISIIAFAIFIGTWLAARGLLEQNGLSRAARVSLALVPIGPFVWALWRFIQGAASLDELQRKIQLEALAIAFPVMMVFLMTLGLLDVAVGLSYENFGAKHLWYYMPIFYFGGLFFASRRYQ